jgi:DNA helicase-2/ATP-dependent DNA helicase PcrA
MTIIIGDKHRSVLDAKGHCLIVGGPGSGKTTLALLKAVQRIDDKLNTGQGILFLSFSRAAVSRVANAVKDHIPQEKRSILAIQTFHSFFWEILRTHGHLLGSPKQLSIVLPHDEKAMREGIELGDPRWNEWEKTRLSFFHSEGRVCFDLFAPLTAELLSRSCRIRDRVAARYPLIIVDEAQDTGLEQWACASTLAERSQVVCLADLDQLIFDHLPGVGPERVEHIRVSLKPLEIDLGSENHRSPGTEIVAFARDIFLGHVRGRRYKGVSLLRFNPKAALRDKKIRQSIGILRKTIYESTGKYPDSIALIASFGSGVAIISAALRIAPAMTHQVLFDEAFVMLASRIGAFLLEPKTVARKQEDIALFLDLLADAHRAKGGKTALETSKQLCRWALKVRSGRVPKVKLVAAVDVLIESAGRVLPTGNPKTDWIRVKRELRSAAHDYLSDVADALDYLVAFNRGERIAAQLSELWLEHGAYPGARAALDDALAQEQLLSGSDHLKGIHVMNIHKCKGKEFDGVVLFRSQHCSPFVWQSDSAPYKKSRRLLRVAITRAKRHILILDEIGSSCPIIGPHTL